MADRPQADKSASLEGRRAAMRSMKKAEPELVDEAVFEDEVGAPDIPVEPLPVAERDGLDVAMELRKSLIEQRCYNIDGSCSFLGRDALPIICQTFSLSRTESLELGERLVQEVLLVGEYTEVSECVEHFTEEDVYLFSIDIPPVCVDQAQVSWDEVSFKGAAWKTTKPCQAWDELVREDSKQQGKNHADPASVLDEYIEHEMGSHASPDDARVAGERWSSWSDLAAECASHTQKKGLKSKLFKKKEVIFYATNTVYERIVFPMWDRENNEKRWDLVSVKMMAWLHDVPSCLRGRLWTLLSRLAGVDLKEDALLALRGAGGTVDSILKSRVEAELSNPLRSEVDIFRRGTQCHDLVKEVAFAFSQHRPDLPYTAGLATACALLFTYCSTLQAITCAIQMFDCDCVSALIHTNVQKHLPYLNVFDHLLEEHAPAISAYLSTTLAVPSAAFLPEWLSGRFCTILPLNVLPRVFDGYFLFGEPFLMRTAIAIFVVLEKEVLSWERATAISMLAHPIEISADDLVCAINGIPLETSELCALLTKYTDSPVPITGKHVVPHDGFEEEAVPINGFGTCTFPNDDTYEGQWREGNRHGSGRYYVPNAYTFEGEFCDDDPPASGTIVFMNKSYFTGAVAFNRLSSPGFSLPAFEIMPHGHGLLYDKSPTICNARYAGEWHMGKRDGFGVQSYDSGATYHGMWAANQRCGTGIMVFPDGSYYAGEWRSDCQDGAGTISNCNGDVLEGTWKRNNLVKGSWEKGSANFRSATFPLALTALYTREKLGEQIEPLPFTPIGLTKWFGLFLGQNKLEPIGDITKKAASMFNAMHSLKRTMRGQEMEVRVLSTLDDVHSLRQALDGRVAQRMESEDDNWEAVARTQVNVFGRFFRLIHPTVFAILAHKYRVEEATIQSLIMSLPNLSPSDTGVPDMFDVFKRAKLKGLARPDESEDTFYPAIMRLRSMPERTTPDMQLKALLEVFEEIVLCIHRGQNLHAEASGRARSGTTVLGAEDMVPIFVYIVLKANVPNMHAWHRILREFGTIALDEGTAEFRLMALESALQFVLALDPGVRGSDGVLCPVGALSDGIQNAILESFPRHTEVTWLVKALCSLASGVVPTQSVSLPSDAIEAITSTGGPGAWEHAVHKIGLTIKDKELVVIRPLPLYVYRAVSRDLLLLYTES